MTNEQLLGALNMTNNTYQLRDDLLDTVDVQKMVNFLKAKQEAAEQDNWIKELKDGDTFILQVAVKQ